MEPCMRACAGSPPIETGASTPDEPDVAQRVLHSLTCLSMSSPCVKLWPNHSLRIRGPIGDRGRISWIITAMGAGFGAGLLLARGRDMGGGYICRTPTRRLYVLRTTA